MTQPAVFLSIGGLKCAGCVTAVEKALQAVPGVASASVNLVERSASITGAASVEALIKAIEASGYRAAELGGVEDLLTQDDTEKSEAKALLRKALVSGVFGLFLMVGMVGFLPMVHAGHDNRIWILIGVLTLAVMLYGGGHFFRGAFSSLRHGAYTMDTLIALGTGSAWIYSTLVVLFPALVPTIAQHAYYEAAVVIIALVNFGSYLEMRARANTSLAIKALIGLQPKTARVIREGRELDIPVGEVGLDETIRVRPGEKLPVDGLIFEGASAINESMITGEAMPKRKQVGDSVIAGTLNTTGSFLYQAKQIGKLTMLAQIIEQVRLAQSSKPAIGRMVDRIAGVFVPIIVAISILTFAIWYLFGPEPKMGYAFVTSITVLLIACPCALGLATPISIMVAVGKAAEYGILIRNGDALQKAAKINLVLFDKTGTLTLGKPTLTDVLIARGHGRSQVLGIAARMEKSSEHPLASALLEYAKAMGIGFGASMQIEVIPGKGMKATADGKAYCLGSESFFVAQNIDVTEFAKEARALRDKACSLMYLAEEGALLGLFAFRDPIKESAANTIAKLKALGIRTAMITGDHPSTAQVVANALGLDEVYAEVLPADKAQWVAKFQSQGKKVAMVGDGINDAPALARADVGIAMGSGTDVAMQSADITIMGDSLIAVLHAIAISKATIRNINQNLLGAFLYNSLSVPIAAGVLYPFIGILLNPMIGGAAMAMSSVTVVTNANRLRSFNPEKSEEAS